MFVLLVRDLGDLRLVVRSPCFPLVCGTEKQGVRVAPFADIDQSEACASGENDQR